MTRAKKPGDSRVNADTVVERSIGNDDDVGFARKENLSLLGYAGPSEQDGCVRLYLTPELDEYYDLREEDVVSQEVFDLMDDFTVSELTLYPGSQGLKVVCRMTDLQTRFLVGELSQSFLETAEAGVPLASAPVDREKRQSADEWFCTYFSGCTDGKVGIYPNVRKCTFRFGPCIKVTTNKKFHVTKDLKC